MSLYRRWIHRKERKLTLRDTNRRVFPFEWGMNWCPLPPGVEAGQNGRSTLDPLESFKRVSEATLQSSDEFFEPPPLGRVTVEGDSIRFDTPLPSPDACNNTLYARLFPAADAKRAVIVVPQWNADSNSHVGLCRVLQRLGITAVRISLPYHEQRCPPGMVRADHMVGPNIGRTLHATRQGVMEVRQLTRWLQEQGHTRIGVMGTSIGSCVSYLAFVHDEAITTGVFNHVSAFFADVVWSGLSTRYVRWGLEGNIELDDLRQCWAPISPLYFIPKLKERWRPHLLISARYDLSFLPDLSERVFEEYRRNDIPVDAAWLPCGHYTTASFPFKYLDGWHICRYLYKNL